MSLRANPTAIRTGDPMPIRGDYQYHARTRGFVMQRYWHWEKERVIRKFSAPRAGDRVIDIGCGSGVIASVLASYETSALGFDANPDAVMFARRQFGRPNLEFEQARIEQIVLPDESVDRTYCMELVEHVYAHQTRELFERAHRFTKRGGSLTVTTPNYGGAWPLVERFLDFFRLVPRLAEAQHVTKFDRHALSTMLESTGWKVERLTTFSTLAPLVSVIHWGLADRVAAMEDRAALPFGNILLAVARKS